MYFNPRSPWRERRHNTACLLRPVSISIHAPRGGSDPGNRAVAQGFCISIHAPRGGSDVPNRLVWQHWEISIHAPRGGSDEKRKQEQRIYPLISIHAPRVGSDPAMGQQQTGVLHFNPRSPCGERLQNTTRDIIDAIFQSTLPVWGATRAVFRGRVRTDISIHAPRVGSDSCQSRRRPQTSHFNPRSPCGERPPTAYTPYRGDKLFQSTLPVWGATATAAAAKSA